MSAQNPDPAPDPQVLDLAVIDELRELGGTSDPELLHELIEIFLEDAPARLAEMERAIGEHDLDGMRRAAHTLKSSSQNMGAVALSRLCLELEHAARANDAEAFAARHADCRPTYDAFEAALTTLRH